MFRTVKIHPLAAFVLALFVVGYFPAIKLLIHKWYSIEDYTHALFIAPIAVYIIWTKKALFTDPNSGSISAVFLILLATISYYFSLTIQVPTFIFLSLFFSILSYLIYFGGFSALPKVAIPLFLFLILIPIPNQILSTLTGSLQLKISEVSEIIIRQLSVPMFREGNIIHVQQLSFEIVEACSGIRSLISMITMAVLISYFTLGRFLSMIGLLIGAIPIALFMNVLRVVVMVVVYHYFQFDLSIGTYHTLFGLFLFLFGVSLLFLIQKVLENWERKRHDS